MRDAGDPVTGRGDSHLDETGETASGAVADNYAPLPVTLAAGDGAWVTDVDGRSYLDCLGAYSALNFGHRNPEVLAAAHAQLERVTLTSRAFGHDQLALFCRELAELAGMECVLPMNTGTEAVETALKAARKWGYEVKGVPEGRANVIAADGNFHGRTISIVSFSTEESARRGFGPYTPGFRLVPYGDADAVAAAIDGDTIAVLLEPIQGEAGVIVPPRGYLRRVQRICRQRNVLLVADEVQSGLGRTGATFACEHADIQPDVYVLGKALGGGVIPTSAVVSSWDVLGVIRPGEHGSTFGGNPLACAVARTVVGMLATGQWQHRAHKLGQHLHARLAELDGQGVTGVRGLGLWAGVDIDPALGSGRQVCERLLERGVLAKHTHGSTLRLAPPLVVEPGELDMLVDSLAAVLSELRARAG